MSQHFSILFLVSLLILPVSASAPEEDFAGGEPKLRRTYWDSVAAGAIRGGVYVVEHPLVTTMDRVALSGNSPLSILRNLIKGGGMTALWRGGSTIAARAGSWPFRMGVYQGVGERVQPGYQRTLCTAGAMTIMDTLLLKPFDTLRIAMVSATKEKPFDLKKALSPRALYKDILSVGGGNLYTWAIYLSADAYFKSLFRSYSEGQELSVPQLLGVSAAITLTSGVFCAPARLVMTTLQAPDAPCSGLVNGFKCAWQSIGRKGFMRHTRLGTIAYLPGNIAATFLFDWLDRKNSMAQNQH